MGRPAQAIVMHEKDNVATALKPFHKGTIVPLEVQGRMEKLTLMSDVPMGHKFALEDLEQGEAVIKYGESIGQSTARINRGEHVHVHNMMSHPRGELR